MRFPPSLLPLLLLTFSRLAAEPLQDGWEYRKGDLGGPYEALRTHPEHNLGVEWRKVSIPHCFNADGSKSVGEASGWFGRQ